MTNNIETLYTDKSRELGAVQYNSIEVMDANVHEYANDPTNRRLTGGQRVGFGGILQNNFVYSVQSDWEAKLANIDIAGTGALGRSAIKLMTGDTSRTGIFTEKFYQGASYLQIAPRFRVVDWDGTGEVLITAQKVINKLLPFGNNATVSEVYGDVNTFVQSLGDGVGGKVKNIIAGAIDTTAIMGADIGKVVHDISRESIKLAMGTANKLLWGEPEPVRVKIGEYFDMNNMILESASIEFSKQMTAIGPLYADFDCTFSSKLALTKQQTGLLPKNAENQYVKVKGTFAEDRAFALKNFDASEKYRKSWQPIRIQESWGLSKLKENYGVSPVDAIHTSVTDWIKS